MSTETPQVAAKKLAQFMSIVDLEPLDFELIIDNPAAQKAVRNAVRRALRPSRLVLLESISRGRYPSSSELYTAATQIDFESLIERLPEGERMAIRWRFGMEDGQPHTYQEVGERLPEPVAGEAARKVVARAIAKLKRWFAEEE